MRYSKSLAPLVLLALSSQPALAERKYQLGTQIDVIGGYGNQINTQFFELQPGRKLFPFYGTIPSLTLKSQGRASELEITYGFLWERFEAEQRIDLTSHIAGLKFTSRLSERMRFRLEDTFYTTPDFTTYALTQSAIQTPEGFQYAYDPIPATASFQSNDGRASLDVDVGPKSYLTFGAAGSYRYYENVTQYRGYLSNQDRFEGNFSYSHKSSKRHTWISKYTAAYNSYKGYGNSLTHSGTVGFDRELRPSLKLRAEAGPSYTGLSLSSQHYVGYIADVNLSKEFRTSRFYVFYSHRPGDSAGIGYVTDTDSAGLGMIHIFGRRVGVNAVASAFRSRQRLDDPLIWKGFDGGLHVYYLLSKHWVLGGAGTYRRNEGTAPVDLEYEQFYLTLSFRAPDFWRGSR